jgi:hypothetical protein
MTYWTTVQWGFCAEALETLDRDCITTGQAVWVSVTLASNKRRPIRDILR